MERIVVLSDMQIPYHDKKMVDAVMQFVGEYEPDQLFCVGDEADSPEPSRWTKGTAGEYAGTLQKGLDSTAAIMKGFKEAIGDRPFHVMRSNHGDRIENYINRYAPALASLRSLEYQTLLGYRENDITYHDRPWRFSSGWLLAHGDEGSLVKTAGGTALSLARKCGLSVVCGHTHRIGIQHEHTAVNGSITSRLYGVEVGNMMDMSKASYLGTGGANWQHGFAVLYKNDKGIITPTIVTITNRSFVVEGVEYGW
jgi:predicted phosphodiesterase